MKFDVVMISAKQGGGKTTTAQAIKDRVAQVDAGKNEWIVHELIFAGPIYEMHDACRKVLTDAGVDPIHKVKDGNLLQLLGTEWGRNHMGENVWVDVIKGRVEKLRKMHEENGTEHLTVVIPDLRFENEFHAMPALKVRLECPEALRKERVMQTSMWRDNTTHASEVGLDAYASAGKFDLYRSTESDSPHFIAAQIIQRLQSGH